MDGILEMIKSAIILQATKKCFYSFTCTIDNPVDSPHVNLL